MRCLSSLKTWAGKRGSASPSLQPQARLSHNVLQGPFSGSGLSTNSERRQNSSSLKTWCPSNQLKKSNYFRQSLQVPALGKEIKPAAGSSSVESRRAESCWQWYQGSQCLLLVLEGPSTHGVPFCCFCSFIWKFHGRRNCSV